MLRPGPGCEEAAGGAVGKGAGGVSGRAALVPSLAALFCSHELRGAAGSAVQFGPDRWRQCLW